MKHQFLALAATLAAGISALPALAQPPLARGSAPLGRPGPTAAERGADKAPFGCDARTPNICHFKIFYPRGSRGVVLPSGMKATVPEINIGRDSYCVAINRAPPHKCERKTINATYNN